MSQGELERFATAALDNPEMVRDFTAVTSLAELAAKLRAGGYDVTEAEVENAHRRSVELSDEQLDLVSGGAFLASLGGIALTAGVVIGGVVAIEAIHSYANGKPSVIGEKLKEFTSRLYPR